MGQRFIRFILRHATFIIVVACVLSVGLGSTIVFLMIDNNVESFVPPDLPESKAFIEISDTYQTSSLIVVGVERKYQDFLNPDMILLVREIVQELEEISGVDSVLSFVNAQFVTERDGRILSDILFTSLQPEDIAQDAKLLRSWELTDGVFITPDGKSIQIIITLVKDASSVEQEAVYHDILRLFRNEKYAKLDDSIIHVAGEPVLNTLIGENMLKDLRLLVPLVMIVTISLLLFFFRRIGVILLPIFVVVGAILCTLGIMSVFGIPLSLLGSVIPVVLVSVGSAYGIHLIYTYYMERSEGKDSHLAIESAYLSVRTPILLSALTTMMGFVALLFTQVIPIRIFGLLVTIGIIIATVFSLMVIPAFLAKRRVVKGQPMRAMRMQFIGDLYAMLQRERILTLLLCVALVIVSIYGIRRIEVSNNLIEYFSQENQAVLAEKFLRSSFQGTRQFTISIEGEESGSMLRPRALEAMDRLKQELLTQFPDSIFVRSFSDFIKRLNQVIHASSSVEEEELLSSEPVSELPSFFDAPEETPELSSDFLPLPSFESTDLPYELLDSAYRSKMTDPALRELIFDIARKLNIGGAAYYEIPTSPEKYGLTTEQDLENLVAQYLLLYSGSLQDWIDNNTAPQEARMIVLVRENDIAVAGQIADVAAEIAQSVLPPEYQFRIGGVSLVERALTNLIVNSQVFSLFIALLAVFLIVAISFRSVMAGALGIIPVVLSLLVNFSVMGWFGITLDNGTALAAACAIGAGIDYVIHYIAAYKKEYRASDSIQTIEMRVFSRTGGAILINAVSVSAGFSVMAFSQFKPLRNMGILIAITIMVAGITSLTLFPILLEMVKPKFIQRIGKGEGK